MPVTSVIFDFDSTLVSVESLDELLTTSLKKTHAPKDVLRLKQELKSITDRGMEGAYDFPTSIAKRLSIAKPTKRDLISLSRRITNHITEGIPRIIERIEERGGIPFIVSGGILDLILPVANALGISTERVFANTPLFDEGGFLTGIEPGPLAQTEGKTSILKILKNNGKLGKKVIMVGDGISDLHPFSEGVASHFVGVGIHAERQNVRTRAPIFVRTVQELDQHILSLITV
jgi:phosphoserine phosphatase